MIYATAVPPENNDLSVQNNELIIVEAYILYLLLYYFNSDFTTFLPSVI